LIKFAWDLCMASKCVIVFCKFVANPMFDRYAHALQASLPSCNGNNDCQPNYEFLIVSKWIGFLALNLQDMVSSRQRTCSETPRQNVEEEAEEALVEKILSTLTTPMLTNLHLGIMQRALHSRAPKDRYRNDYSNCWKSAPKLVASVFVGLYKQEVQHFLQKPSPAKTRRWGRYRKCLERIFDLTPPSTLFACPGGYPALSEHSANLLDDIWNQYGQCNLHRSISIMVAAGLHVNASASFITPPDTLPTRERDSSSSLHLKQLKNSFSLQAKNCIINTFFKNAQETISPPREGSIRCFSALARSVRRELSIFGREATVGLGWWNELTNHLRSLLKKNKEHGEQKKLKKSVSYRDVAKACSTLQNSLTAISGKHLK